MAIKIIFLAVFFAVMIGVGIYCRKGAVSVDGFVLGGRSVGPWLTAFAYGTSYFSAVIFVGYAGQFGWKFGVASTWIGIGNALIGSLLAWLILGRRTRVMTTYLGTKTMPEFFEKRYGSSSLKIAASMIVFVFLIPYTASLYNGLSRLFESSFGIPYIYCVIGMALLTAVYVIIGGYMATAINDFIQGIIMLFGIVVVIIAVLNQKGGFTEAFETLSKIPTESGAEISGAFTSFFGPEPLSLMFVVLLTSLGTWGLPQMIQKFYSIKSDSAVVKGTIISTVFALIVAGGCYFLGGFGRLFGDIAERDPETGAVIYDSIVPGMLKGLPDVIIGIVLVLVVSASMSTLSSLVLTSSSTLTLDMIVPASKRGGKEGMKEKGQMFTMRVFIAVFIIISAVIAIIQATSNVTFIAQLMGVSWGALAGAFLAPFMLGLYMKHITKTAVWCSFASGVGIMGTNLICTLTGTTFLNAFWSSPINAGALAMAVGLVIVPTVSILGGKKAKKNAESIFICYEKKKKEDKAL